MNINRENEEQFKRLDESLDKRFGKSFFISNKENLSKLINERKEILMDYISKHNVEAKDIDVNELVPNPYNRALDPKAVEETGKNIKESGVIKPIIYVEFDPHTLQKPFNENKKPLKMVIDGHHRLEALKQAGYKTVPAIKATNGILTSDKEKEIEVEKSDNTIKPKVKIKDSEIKNSKIIINVPPQDNTQKGILTDMAVIAAGDLAAEGVAHGISHFLKPKKPKTPKIPKFPKVPKFAPMGGTDSYQGTPDTNKCEDTINLSKAVKISAIKPIISSLFNRKLLSRNVFERTLAQGGHTVNLAGQSPKTGFAFSPYKDREAIIPKSQFSVKHVSNYVQRNQDLLNKPNHHLGSWHNTDTGNVHLDVSVVHPHQATALSEATKHKQLAIYDLGAGKEIPVQSSEMEQGRGWHGDPERHAEVAHNKKSSMGKDAASSAVKPREKGKTFLKAEDRGNNTGRMVRDAAIGTALFHPKVQRVISSAVRGLGRLAVKHPNLVGTVASMGALALSVDNVDLEKLSDTDADSIGQEISKILMINSTEDLEKVIRRQGDKYVLYSRDGSRRLSKPSSKKATLEREHQVEYFKHHKSLTPEDLVKFINDTFGKVTFERDDVREFSSDKIKAMGDKLGVNWDKISMDQLIQGTKVELEHLDVTGGDLEATVKIALAHIEELPDYYTRLKQMESENSNSEPTEKGLGSSVLAGLKALKPVFPKTEKIPMPKNLMAGTLKDLDEKYQNVLRNAANVATKKFIEKQDIAKQVFRAQPNPVFAQANNGIDQEKINNINTELLNMYQMLQNIEARSREEDILSEDELNTIIVPLKNELQNMISSLTPSEPEETGEEAVNESEPERHVGGAERELTYPATNFSDKSVTTNDMEKQLVGMGGSGQGRGFHGDPERHAEAARERWEQEGVPPGGKQKPTAGIKSETPEGVLVIPKAIRDVATKTAKKAGSHLARQAGEVIGELGWQAFGTIAGLILYRYLGGESTKVGELLSVGKQGLKEALKRGFELRRIDALTRQVKMARLVKEWSQLP